MASFSIFHSFCNQLFYRSVLQVLNATVFDSVDNVSDI